MRLSSNAMKLALSLGGASLLLCGAAAQRKRTAIAASPPPTFYKNVVPILQQHCQACHRTGEIAPMPLVTYAETRRYAREIKNRVTKRIMPPWFADPCCGRFADDPSLTPQQIATLAAWVDAGAPAGNPRDAPPPRRWPAGWIIPRPDDVIRMPKPVAIPAHGDVEYTYEIVPTGFTKNKWVQMSEIRPSSRQNVHHAVVYVRPPGSKWLRHAPIGTPFTASTLTNPQDRRDAEWTDSDILLVYAPGSSPDEWPAGMAKFIPAGSDLVFQMHYVTKGHPATDQASIGLVFTKRPPKQRVLTLQLTNDSFIIPPGVPDFRVEVHGTLPNDCTLLSFFPHMHLRGKKFEYRIIHRNGRIETLLRVHYNFFWQLSYRLAQQRFLKAGTELQAVAWYDNSRDNPHNPDPTVAVRWGDQTYDEMMVGFFDVAVPANVNKWQFFIRRNSSQTKK
ncbi:MAG TPA: thiol-disulfide isomerase [Candidatus Dormibacteraeota bacterium]|nr:thiol-disulfide isomerase [Candidatus Dormibacteraeota bacterium]